MGTAQLPANNGGTDREDRVIERRVEPTSARPGEVGLGEVVTDAIDHVREIVSDTVAIGKLEARRVVDRVEQTTRDVAPRVVIGAMAAVLGMVGAVLALIAIFIGLGAVIESVAVRLAIFAAVFLVLAAVGGLMAAKGVREPAREPPSKLTP